MREQKRNEMSKPAYCVVKTSSRTWGGILSILLAIGGAVTATYVLKYIAGLRSDTDEITRRGINGQISL